MPHLPPSSSTLSLTGVPDGLVIVQPHRQLLRKGIVRVACIGDADADARPAECCVYVFTDLIVLAAPRKQCFREAIFLSAFATLTRVPAASRRLSLPLQRQRGPRAREALVLESGGRWAIHAEAAEIDGWEADIRRAIPVEELC